jgi:hypothetical protein
VAQDSEKRAILKAIRATGKVTGANMSDVKRQLGVKFDTTTLKNALGHLYAAQEIYLTLPHAGGGNVIIVAPRS